MHPLVAAIVILISFDGLRPDHITPKTAPNIYRFSQAGVSAEYMEPTFPASTFINHASLITGCTAGEHGIVSNHFIDSQKGEFHMSNDAGWQECEPLWAAASRGKIKNASYVWPMTNKTWRGARPTYTVEIPEKGSDKFFEKFSDAKEWRQILDWLKLPARKRPQLILGYFPDVDGAGHRFGPHAPETLRAVRKYDRQFGKFLEAVGKMGMRDSLNIVLVSDHGMALGKKPVFTDRVLNAARKKWPGKGRGRSWQFMASSNTHINFYIEDAGQQAEMEKFLKKFAFWNVYSAPAFPKQWSYNNLRSGDLLVTVAPPKYLTRKGDRPKKGYHGYDPQTPEMRAFFAASGPAFKKVKIETIRNIDVAPTLAEILALPFDGKKSGQPRQDILR